MINLRPEGLSQPHISVVSPVYRAEGCIQELCRRLHAEVGAITSNYEIILVDDASPDRSWDAIVVEAQADAHVIGIRLL